MKKILAIIMCALIMCAFPVVAFAEGEESVPVDENTSVTDNLPTEDETVTESVLESVEATPETEALAPEVTEPTPIPPEQTKFTSEEIVAWIKAHFEEISVVVSLVLNMIYMAKKHKLLNKSISDTNHNAITVSENSDRAIAEALKMMQSYKKSSEEEKKKLQEALATATNYLETAKLANVEFANELAELLVLANIPNSKKDELYARHMAAVKNISEAKRNITPTEVIEDDNGKAE